MKSPIVTTGVVATGALFAVALVGCAGLDSAGGRGTGASTPTSLSSAPSASVSAGGSPGLGRSTSGAPGAGSATGSAGSGSAVASSSPPTLNCENVFDEAWPAGVARPAAAGWDGPTCSVEAGAVVVTWAFAGGTPAPEVTDAAFVALRKGFADDGWTEQETGGEDRNGEVVAALKMESPGGRPGTISYVSGGDSPAELSVRFQG